MQRYLKSTLALSAMLFAVACHPRPASASSLADLRRDFSDRFVQTVQLPSGTTHYEDRGEGPVVIMIHGVSGPMAVWDRSIDAVVGAGYRVVRYDLLGRGFSARSEAQAYDLPTYVRQLEELVSALRLDGPLRIVGSSFGAVVASEYALHHTTQVAGLVLVGPAGFPIELPALAGVRDLPFVGNLITGAFGASIIRKQNRKYAVDEARLADLWPFFDAQLDVPGTAESMLATMRNAPVTTYIEGYRALGKTHLPVGVIWGRQDVTFPYVHSASLMAAIPDAELVSVDDAAHLPQMEQPSVTSEALVRLLSPDAAEQPRASDRLSLPSPIDEQLDTTPLPESPAFESAFFEQFTSAEQVLELAPGVDKTYQFPTFYADVTTSVALFAVDYDAAARLVSDPNLKPMRAGFDTALVAISSYRYGAVRGMRPYNEVAVSILVKNRNAIDLPLTGLLSMKTRELHAYVIAMPVTTRENQIRGRKLWGLPKTVEAIDMRQIGDDFVTTVRDRQGRLVLETRVPMLGSAEEASQSVVLHSMLNGDARESRATSQGAFVSHADIGALSRSFTPGEASSLSLGTSPAATALRDLKIRRAPINTRFGQGIESAFTLPLN